MSSRRCRTGTRVSGGGVYDDQKSVSYLDVNAECLELRHKAVGPAFEAAQAEKPIPEAVIEVVRYDTCARRFGEDFPGGQNVYHRTQEDDLHNGISTYFRYLS